MFKNLFKKKKENRDNYVFENNEIALSEENKESVEYSDIVHGIKNVESASAITNGQCSTINIVPFEWAKPIISDYMAKKINIKMFRYIFLFIFLCLFFAVVFGGVIYFENIKEGIISKKINESNTVLTEQEVVAENIAVYKAYIEIPNNPAIYTQFYGISFLAVRNGLLVGRMTFSSSLVGEAAGNVNKDSFALETGKRIENVKIVGVWTISGTISPRAGKVADSTWLMEFAKQTNILFARQNINAYARGSYVSGRKSTATKDTSSDVVITILLWE